MLIQIPSLLLGAVWNEPRHKQVVTEADTLGLFQIESASPLKSIARKVRHLAGSETPDTIEINSFYTDPSSLSARIGTYDDEWTLHLKASRKYYLFLKGSHDANSWRLASPTAGFAEVGDDGMVSATFRISLHRALLDSSAYELLQICIFEKLHSTSTCSSEVYKYIDEQLSKDPRPSIQTRQKRKADHFSISTRHSKLRT